MVGKDTVPNIWQGPGEDHMQTHRVLLHGHASVYTNYNIYSKTDPDVLLGLGRARVLDLGGIK